MNIRWYFIVLCITGNFLQATIFVPGNSTEPDTFTQPIAARVFDRTLGNFIVGLSSNATNYTISLAKRPLDTRPASFTGIAGDSFADAIALLALATSIGNTESVLGYVVDAGVSVGGIALKKTTQTASSDALNDANEDPADGIIALSASNDFFFAVVQPNGGVFGDTYSGIATIAISQDDDSITLEVKDATTGNIGNKAQEVDPSTDEVRIMNDPVITNTATLHWDEQLERLYLGLVLTTSASATDGAKAVVVSYVSDTGKLTPTNIAANSAFTGGGTNKIVGVEGADENLSIKYLRTLHSSPGPSYLIVNGNNGAYNTVGNQIFALPLVDDPSTPSVHGTLARKDSALVNNVFVTPATAPAHLVTNTETTYIVGSGNLPIEADQSISDIEVVDDTVYVSLISDAQDTNNDTGLFYSHALYDENGKLCGWTPWTKRAFPADAFTDTPNPDPVSFFAIDVKTGFVWGVDSSKQHVEVTQWNYGSGTSLPARLNEIMQKGCFSVLDLDQATTGFTGASGNTSRYTLFGGGSRVVFARTSIASGTDVTSPNTPTTDYSLSTNLLDTSIAHAQASVRVLEYSRRTNGDGNQNYFFAGTDQGLYVFANSSTGAGFTINSTVDALNAAPFSTGSWHLIETIAGATIDVKTLGNVLYVLTFETSSATPIKNIVYRIPFTTNIATMFHPSNITAIAATKTSPIFTSTSMFTSLDIIATNAAGTTEQLVLATNTGLYRSSRAGGVQAATSQTNASWVAIDTSFYSNTMSVPFLKATSNPCMIWALCVRDQYGYQTCERSSIAQLGGNDDAGPFNFVPSFFNNTDSTNSEYTTLERSWRFWSDGARRFFIINLIERPCNRNYLMLLPFNTLEWKIGAQSEQILQNNALNSVTHFHWIRQIGSTGIILAGTKKGVISLD